jgi:hypothetical protein
MYVNEMQIIRDIARYSDADEPTHRWSLTVAGEIVSTLWVAIATGEIMQVETLTAHQGRGYASALYRQAATEITIYHAPESHRSYEGSRFAASVGGDSLPCLHGCCDIIPDFDDES